MNREVFITSKDFIWYFITILQLNFLDNKEDIWSFDIEELKKFIFLSKKDYKYYDILKDFDFSYLNEELFSIDYITAINNARDKHVITVIVEDIAYLSRSNINTSILFYKGEFEGIMRNFVEDFKFYMLDPKGYRAAIIESESGNQIKASYDHMVYNLKRGIANKEF